MSRRFLEALKAKYGTPQAVMAVLGLDAALLKDESENDVLHKHAGKVIDLLMKRYGGSTQRVLQKLGMDEAMLTGVARRGEDRFGLRRSSRDDIPPKIETMPEQNLSSGWRAEDDEPDDDGYERFRERMREHGLSEDEVEEACELARDHVRRRGANGRDKHADDFMPVNRVRGGAPGRFGGERPGRRADGGSEVEAARAYTRQIGEEGERKAVDWATPEEELRANFRSITAWTAAVVATVAATVRLSMKFTNNLAVRPRSRLCA